MTLVVAQILDNGAIAMFSDTKLLYGYVDDDNYDRVRSRQIYQAAQPKILLLRRDLAIGVAGSGIVETVDALTSLRELSVDDVLERLRQFQGVDFIVAALDPPRLWTIKHGELDDRPSRAWVGDVYALFQEAEKDGDHPEEFDQQQRLLAAMQSLVHRIQPLTVGGYVIHLTTTADGFRFSPHRAKIGPSHLYGVLTTAADGTVSGHIVAPPGVDPTTTILSQLVGKPPTPGSIAMYVPPASTAWLFPQGQPSKPIVVQGASPQEIIAKAKALGHRISMCDCLDDDHITSVTGGSTEQIVHVRRTFYPPMPPPSRSRPDFDLVVEVCDRDGAPVATLPITMTYSFVPAAGTSGPGWIGSDSTGIVALAFRDNTEGTGTGVRLAANLKNMTGRLPAEIIPVLSFLALLDVEHHLRLHLAKGAQLAEADFTESPRGWPLFQRLVQACEALATIQLHHSAPSGSPIRSRRPTTSSTAGSGRQRC